jgi:hypothetical protein
MDSLTMCEKEGKQSCAEKEELCVSRSCECYDCCFVAVTISSRISELQSVQSFTMSTSFAVQYKCARTSRP